MLGGVVEQGGEAVGGGVEVQCGSVTRMGAARPDAPRRAPLRPSSRYRTRSPARETSAAGRAGRRRRRVRIRVSAPASPSHTAIALCSSFATASPRPSCAGPRKCDPDNIPGPTRRRRHRWSNMRPGSRSGRLARKLTCRPPHPPARVPPVPARSGRARPVPGRRTRSRRAGRSCRGTRSTSAPVSARSSRAPCG